MICGAKAENSEAVQEKAAQETAVSTDSATIAVDETVETAPKPEPPFITVDGIEAVLRISERESGALGCSSVIWWRMWALLASLATTGLSIFIDDTLDLFFAVLR
jgi:hypothetical protein